MTWTGGALGVVAFARTRALPAAARSYAAASSSSASSSSASSSSALPMRNDEMDEEEPGAFRNVDGERFEDGRYAAFKNVTRRVFASSIESRQQESGGKGLTVSADARIIDGVEDPVRTFAYGTDASFYRLEPKLVVKVETENEVVDLLPEARRLGTPVTFRAGGTSLSGQAVTDSVLMKLSHNGKNFRKYKIEDDGKLITVEPGLIGGEVNRLLAGYARKNKLPQYKIGPDPASIDSCMIGGIVSNNSSGMCCGVKQNTYRTLKDMRIVFVDGTVLDTSDEASRAAFLRSHATLVAKVQNLARRVQADEQLTALIRKKFSIKCTTGYSINALVDFPPEDPIEMIKRLMIGSEGTLGFISEVTMNTVPEHPYKASAFVMFKDVMSACTGAAHLRRNTSVDAVEMFDNASLKQSQSKEMLELVRGLDELDDEAASLLIECRGETSEALAESIATVTRVLEEKADLGVYKTFGLSDYPFEHEARRYKAFWDMRKNLIPLVGGARETGTSMLIEDVAVEVDKLGPLTVDLIDMFRRFGYNDASCFGHALEGNLHLVFSQGFRTEAEVERYSAMMEELAEIVAGKYQGSLKAEHGTGRNMAPFVEMEWGTKAYQIMWELKEIFDPEYVLNPGVILNEDMDVHKKALKPSPPADPIVDKCIECGFCESNCPSKDLSLTPRQRITVYREIQRLSALSVRSAEEEKRLSDFQEIFTYMGNATCATDGMCQMKCPVKINTGQLIKSLRNNDMEADSLSKRVSLFVANNFATLTAGVPYFLSMVSGFHRVLGAYPLEMVSGALNRVSGHYIPKWNAYMPKGAAAIREPAPPSVSAQSDERIARKVVYLPSCVTRMMGPALGDYEEDSVHSKLMSIMEKAGYEVIIPESLASSCCGMMFDSRGLKSAAGVKEDAMKVMLEEASEGGKYPIVIDTSPCLASLKQNLEPGSPLRFSLYEPVDFINRFLVDRLEFSQVRDSVAIHVPCSSKKMHIEDSFMQLASRCAKDVHQTSIPCCGMAGDRGMRYPELTQASLQNLNIPSECSDGYSTSRTCEMSLSNHSGIHFRGLVYLVDEATKSRVAAASTA